MQRKMYPWNDLREDGKIDLNKSDVFCKGLQMGLSVNF